MYTFNDFLNEKTTDYSSIENQIKILFDKNQNYRIQTLIINKNEIDIYIKSYSYYVNNITISKDESYVNVNSFTTKNYKEFIKDTKEAYDLLIKIEKILSAVK